MIRIACADDSAFLRQIIKEVLESSGKIQVIASLKNGKEAVECVKTMKPDLLMLDCEMPVMNGLEALRHIMKETPLPVIMFSSLTSEGAAVTLKALEYGAVDFLLKPTTNSNRLEEVKEQLISKIEMICKRRRVSGEMPKAAAVRGTDGNLGKIAQRNIDLLAMGSSTGGVQAAMQVVPLLPPNSPPMVWVQHMPEHFTASFAQRLDGISKMRVKEAEHGDIVERGRVYLARGGVQMRVAREGVKLRLDVGGTEKVTGFAPSCDVLFSSVSELYGSNAVGVILTGMGSDGTNGLGKMHAKGALVIGQDEATSTVYGMPRAAYEAGAVDVQLPIQNVAAGITKACGLAL